MKSCGCHGGCVLTGAILRQLPLTQSSVQEEAMPNKRYQIDGKGDRMKKKGKPKKMAHKKACT